MGTSMQRALMTAALVCVLNSGSGAFAQGAADDARGPSQIALTQPQIDNLIGAEKDIHAVEAAARQAGNQDKPVPGSEAKLTAVAKAHGFDSLAQMTNVSFSIGVVMAGLDPETKAFVGEKVMLGKQIAQVKAQAGMSPQQKAEALDELNAALQQAEAVSPMPANIAIVKANAEKLASVVQTED